MKQLIFIILSLAIAQSLLGQEKLELPKFYLGLSYGTSYSIGDFADTDIGNSDAGFAKNGRKIDVFGGVLLGNKTILTAGFRYQSFETEVEDIIEDFKLENPVAEFTGSTEDWQTYAFLVGLAYSVNTGKRIKFFPRIGVSPLWVTNPGLVVNAPNTTITNNFERSSGTGVGLGYEVGVGLQTNLGKRFSLLPTFTFSGGVATINDIITITDNVIIRSDYQSVIQSFNLGLSLGYRFY
ncbi:MAG: outer membrane beta-barrel protein [Bacteroidota bacterium]